MRQHHPGATIIHRKDTRGAIALSMAACVLSSVPVRQYGVGWAVCRGCGTSFVVKTGRAGHYCARSCYEDKSRPNRSRNASGT